MVVVLRFIRSHEFHSRAQRDKTTEKEKTKYECVWHSVAQYDQDILADMRIWEVGWGGGGGGGGLQATHPIKSGSHQDLGAPASNQIVHVVRI